MKDGDIKVQCDNCKAVLDEDREDLAKPVQNPCPHCGSTKRYVSVFLFDEVPPPHDMLRAKAKDDSYPSRDKVRVDLMVGDEQKAPPPGADKNALVDREWVDKYRRIDKDKDLYEETVVDKKTGKILHSCKEPLSQHRGHGSAKMKNEAEKKEKQND